MMRALGISRLVLRGSHAVVRSNALILNGSRSALLFSKILDPTLRGRPYSTDFAIEDVQTALKPELDEIRTYCALLNQTSLPEIRALVDLVPAMQVYRSVAARGYAFLVIGHMLGAIRQTARDAREALHSATQAERVEIEAGIKSQLRDALNEVAGSIVQARLLESNRLGRSTIGSLFAAFETIDPYAGVEFYHALDPAVQPLCGGFVVPCMVKARQPFSDIQAAFQSDSHPDSRTAASMVLSCLKYGEIDAAKVLYEQVLANPDSTAASRAFVINAMIGDSTADAGLAAFQNATKSSSGLEAFTPHHSAMERLLRKLWDQNKDITEQLNVFEKYLKSMPYVSESKIKTVTHGVVSNVLEGTPEPEDALPRIVELSNIYDTHADTHTIFLNILVSQVARKWDQKPSKARDLILMLLENYNEIDDSSAVSFRVRLNALENLEDVDNITKDLWTKRLELARTQPLQKFDWLSLLLATNCSKWFKTEWGNYGKPFYMAINKFGRSKGYGHSLRT